MKKTVALLTALVLVALLSGCGSVDKRIYGEWQNADQTSAFGFGTDFMGYMQQSGFTIPIVYKLEKDLLSITFGEEANAFDTAEEEDIIKYSVTFFGDDEFVLESPPNSGNQYSYTRKTNQ